MEHLELHRRLAAENLFETSLVVPSISRTSVLSGESRPGAV